MLMARTLPRSFGEGSGAGLHDRLANSEMRFFWQDKILYEKKTGEQTVQVIQRDDRRELCFGNHIIQSAVSLSNPDVLQLDYTRAMMAVFMFSPQAANILHLGLGAGSLPRFIHQQFPQSKQIAVELCPSVIEAAYNYFFLPQSPRLEVIEEDGKNFFDGCKSRFDLIFQDAFHADGVSRHLESMAFFQKLRDHLNPGGWLINNVWGSDRANLNLIRQNLTGIFPQLYTLSVSGGSNVIFFAGESEAAPSPATVKENATKLSQDTGIDISRFELNIKTIRAGGNEEMRIMG